jgi:hypothetical protein
MSVPLPIELMLMLIIIINISFFAVKPEKIFEFSLDLVYYIRTLEYFFQISVHFNKGMKNSNYLLVFIRNLC